MLKFRYLSSSVLAAVVLAGCSSSSSTPDVAEVTSLEQLSFSTSSATVSSNGQPFAATGQVISDGFDSPGAVNLVALSKNGSDNTLILSLTSADYRITRGENLDGGGDGSFIITVDGEELEFIAPDNNLAEPLVAMRGADKYTLTLVTFGAGLASYTNLISLESDSEVYKAIYAFGFETDPANIRTTGTGIYTGNVMGYGDVTTPMATDGTVLTGTGTINVNFVSNDVYGTMAVIAGDDTFNLGIDPTRLAGNGFSTTMSCVGTATCTSNSEIGGTLFGVNADQISGVATLDVTEGDKNLNGAVGFTFSE